ncbi:cyclic pyranopterin monophosphate synthase MoaC [Bartonella apis]|uniref:cyclic pyranopterin monophosphate synthase MoaC n=1 Tax=Bartonella apis TaxID=1686310 RepID=UPI00242A8B50|nr:cyclic pyranopterin monophosphate synthase MoaC [Bartonella apis]MCT6824289.1 cyclic pyranopterin monophosphate synthase MoaC [Bartonella apis]MCT6860034.1 cyclic pyranopterin monophosphate synthase MoaC [Bartonella apis]MCT6886316.1 cyclic pyranopterin monophosphate synthase MoaC [Bartonella apis]
MSDKLTHVNAKGEAHMVDVGGKHETDRIAIAHGSIKMARDTLEAIENGNAPKGDVLATARIAGIMGAKKTSELIPLCHPLMLTKIAVDITADHDLPGYQITATVGLNGKTGVEMEALSAVSITCLTIYDMAKALDKSMVINNICLLEKRGGKSGTWKREENNASHQC